jgi:cytochrome b
MMKMKRIKAYDLPTRILHWSFAALFVTSFSIGKLIDDESVLFAYHMLSGILMVLVAFLRILWGLFGSETARLRSLKLRPDDLLQYFKSLTQGQTKRYLGHNPASSYTLILVIFFSLALAGTGLTMVITGSEGIFEDFHELLAHGFLALVLFHLLGVFLHESRHSDGMALSMFNGNKGQVEGSSGLKSNHPFAATFFSICLLWGAITLNQGYNQNTQELSLYGTKIFLGEVEDHDEGHSKAQKKWNNDEDDQGDHHEDDD